ncbi:conserved hypothetical protein [Catenulispora acidiphila DSM 44928]|uniref:Uncharacterized protein n=1 Tax=Catenulispora acidiphila (strain DSM 44928 / JCM 14897 / NBRC 102108 / NRRL B-24433 / ID139908) TaxID=479433 RepID=C7QGW5_CATAD|nr:DUF5691 domain-containing protein [Catenulispora acidiphila]ACU76815.1 conserved hypothetical protein [Catenulispora acidiphila DSM 44928]
MNEASHQTGSEVWQDLVSTALVGTDRRTPPAAGDFAAPGDSPAAALLSSAALMSAWRRAGNAGSAYSAVLVGDQDTESSGAEGAEGTGSAGAPAAKSAALDARPLLPTATSARLTALVASRSEALPEYLGAAAKTGCRAPAELLPPLFDYARGSIAVRADLMKLAGPRGTWLAKQNQQWSTFTRFAAAPDPEAWLSEKPHERVGYLNWFRGKDPASARVLVEEAWTQAGLSAETRAAYVEALAVGLGAEDEQFLESALDDKSRQVRAEAVRLLATLPSSRFAERMTARLHERVQVAVEGTAVLVTLKDKTDADAEPANPAEPTEDQIRDGIGEGWVQTEEERRLARMQPSYWLEDLIASAPLAAWEHYGLSPAELLRATAANRWEANACHRGWRSATLRQKDSRWAEAFCAVNASSEMLELLSEEAAERWCLAVVASHRSQYSIHSAPIILSRLGRPWPDAVCQALLDSIPAYLPNATRNDVARFFGMDNLAGRWMPPSFADAVAAKGEQIRAELPLWAEDLDDLAAMLRDRALMLAELDSV